MNDNQERRERVHEVRRIFEEHGFGSAELLEGWDGADVEQLAAFLTEEEFQTLLDQLQEEGEFQGQ